MATAEDQQQTALLALGGLGVAGVLGVGAFLATRERPRMEFGPVDLPSQVVEGNQITGSIMIENTGGDGGRSTLEMRVRIPAVELQTPFTVVDQRQIPADDAVDVPISSSPVSLPAGLATPFRMILDFRLKTSEDGRVTDTDEHQLDVVAAKDGNGNGNGNGDGNGNGNGNGDGNGGQQSVSISSVSVSSV